MRAPARYTEADVERLIDELRAEFPAFRIVPKEGDALSRWIDRALRLVTLGGQHTYLTQYYTVLGDKLYVPAGWERAPVTRRLATLRHERVHLRQRRRYTLPGMAVLYFLPILPIGLAYGRARIEWEAYRESLRAIHELEGVDAVRDPALKAWMVERFTGPSYGWMWPFPKAVGRWYDEALLEMGVG